MIQILDSHLNEITELNPISFGEVQKGIESDIITILMYYSRYNDSLPPITNVRLNAINLGEINSKIFNGTYGNNFKSLILGRSCGAIGIESDYHLEFKELSPSKSLKVGDMISSSARYIELKMAVPWDIEDVDLAELTLIVSYD